MLFLFVHFVFFIGVRTIAWIMVSVVETLYVLFFKRLSATVGNYPGDCPSTGFYCFTFLPFTLFHLALSKVKQLSWHNRRKDDGRTKSLLIQDSGTNHKMESTETTSLTDLRLGSVESESDAFVDNDNKISTSASMGDINEADSGKAKTVFD